jgi:hypothetical protein
MDYRVSRTFITDSNGRMERLVDPAAHLVPAASARLAALAFIAMEGGVLVGPVSDVPGDSATATASCSGRFYVVLAERSHESVAPRSPVRPTNVTRIR